MAFCFQCQQSTSRPLMNGWKFPTGGYAQLCFRCSRLYESGMFCAALHACEDGWKICKSCGIHIHCGCIASLTDYSLNDFDEMTCIDCMKTKNMINQAPRGIGSVAYISDVSEVGPSTRPESSAFAAASTSAQSLSDDTPIVQHDEIIVIHDSSDDNETVHQVKRRKTCAKSGVKSDNNDGDNVPKRTNKSQPRAFPKVQPVSMKNLKLRAGNIKGALSTISKWRKKLESDDPSFLEKLSDEGGLFTPLFLPNAKILPHLLQTLLQKFHPNLNVFKFNGNSLAITLEDVLFMTHLPIDGEPVLCTDSPSKKAYVDVFGDEIDRGLPELETLALDANKSERQRKVAVLMMILSCFIKPSGNGLKTPTSYVQLLEDLSNVHKYAWGAALLAFLLGGMQSLSKTRKVGKHGNFWVVLAFFFVRIPKLWGAMNIEPSERNNSQPLLSWVIENLQVKCKDNKGSYIKQVDIVLSNLKSEDIEWRPYLGIVLPNSLQSQNSSRSFLRLGPIFCNNFVVHHQPHLVLKQFGIPDDEKTRSEILKVTSKFGGKIKHKDNRGPFKHNFEKDYEYELTIYKENNMLHKLLKLT